MDKKLRYLSLLLVLSASYLEWNVSEAQTITIPGCYPKGTLCDDFNGRLQNFTEILTTKRFAYCPDDRDQIYLECLIRNSKGCLTTSCMKSSPKKTNDQCNSVTKTEDDPNYSHTINAFQESCNSREEKIVCCQPDSEESVLLAGYGAEQHEFPHQALILMSVKSEGLPEGQYSMSQCGGTIYNENWILTAAHCVTDSRRNTAYSNPNKPDEELNYAIPFEAKQAEVVVGTNIAAIAPASYRYRVKRVIVHEGYTSLLANQNRLIRSGQSPFVTKNDLALLEVEKPIAFNDDTMALKMAPANFVPDDHAEKLVIIGWGTTDNLDLTEYLQKGDLALRDETRDCNYNGFNSTEHLCIGGIVDGVYGKTAGGGDSGGPAICRDSDGFAVHCGVTSFGGDDKNCSQIPSESTCTSSVYADVSNFRDWIISKAGPQDTGSTKFLRVPLYGIDAGNELSQVKITTGDKKSCGGTLVSSNTVVTAAHCALDINAKSKSGLKVTFDNAQYNVKSMTLLTSSGKQRTLNDRFYRKYKRTRFQTLIEDPYYESDVVVIKLASAVRGAQPIQMSTSKLTESKTAIVHEAAWMRNTTRGLRKFPVTIVSRSNCEGRYNRISQNTFDFKMSPSDVCMVEKYSGGSSCDRDIGGGVFCESPTGTMLCGIQIFRMCDYSTPKVIADISHYASDIKLLL